MELPEQIPSEKAQAPPVECGQQMDPWPAQGLASAEESCLAQSRLRGHHSWARQENPDPWPGVEHQMTGTAQPRVPLVVRR